MDKPPVQAQRSLRNYIANRQCLVETESAFAYHKGDLVTLAPGREGSVVGACVEWLLREWPCGLLQVFSLSSIMCVDVPLSVTDGFQAMFCSEVSYPSRSHAFLESTPHPHRRVSGFGSLSDALTIETQETALKSDDPKIHYYTRSRIDAFAAFITTSLIFALLVVPIWLLYPLSHTLDAASADGMRVGVLLVATLIFSAVLALFTKATGGEILVACAG